MINKIGQLEENALIEENYAGNFPRQKPIYLNIDWKTGEITVLARNYQIGGTPAREWNGYIHTIQLPPDIDAERLGSDISQYYSEKLDCVRSGWSEYYNGNNYKGKLTDNAQEFLYEIDRDIENVVYLSLIDTEKFTDYLLDAEIIDEEGN